MKGNGGPAKAVLTREQILAAVDMKIEEVAVPEWGGVVYVKALSGRARDQFDASRYRLKGKEVEMIHENTRATLVALSVCDPAGQLQFSEADVKALGEKNALALERVFEVAQRLSGLRPQDLETKLKNSEADPIASSSSN